MLLLSDPYGSNKNRGGEKKPLRVIEDLTCLTRIDGRDETRADSMMGCWALGWQDLGVRIQTLGGSLLGACACVCTGPKLGCGLGRMWLARCSFLTSELWSDSEWGMDDKPPPWFC